MIRIAPSLLLLAAGSVFADNITISDHFPEAAPEIAASPVSCSQAIDQPYFEAASITVSTTGDYEIADAGNLLGFSGTGQGIIDIVINIYEGNFDPENPAVNRIASIDEGQAIPLESGNAYILVIQPYCSDSDGVFGIVARGSGTISGAGFVSDALTTGSHAPSDPTAVFPDGIGNHSYDVSPLVSVPRTGLYYVGDVGINFNAGIALLAYENSFNPANTATNLAGIATSAGSLLLDSGKFYVLVAVDINDLGGEWQFSLFPPGPTRFNESMRGAWVTPGVDGSGIMMEVGRQSSVLFFAWFTYPDAPVVTLDSASGTRKAADIGSTDQRWLTGFGPIHSSSNVVDIRYENSTGGAFNSTEPKPATDSNYGLGTAEAVNCSQVDITYDLPGGVAGATSMFRAIPDSLTECLGMVNADVIQPLP
jgi:hypothetical protein